MICRLSITDVLQEGKQKLLLLSKNSIKSEMRADLMYIHSQLRDKVTFFFYSFQLYRGKLVLFNSFCDIKCTNDDSFCNGYGINFLIL